MMNSLFLERRPWLWFCGPWWSLEAALKSKQVNFGSQTWMRGVETMIKCYLCTWFECTNESLRATWLQRDGSLTLTLFCFLPFCLWAGARVNKAALGQRPNIKRAEKRAVCVLLFANQCAFLHWSANTPMALSGGCFVYACRGFQCHICHLSRLLHLSAVASLSRSLRHSIFFFFLKRPSQQINKIKW